MIHRPGILHILPDALSRLYTFTHTELNATCHWGTLPNISFIEKADEILTPSDYIQLDSVRLGKDSIRKPKSRTGGGEESD